MTNTTITPTAGALTASGSAPAGVGFYVSSVGSVGRKAGYRTEATQQEQRIHTGRCRLYGIYPELQTTGTLTFRDAPVPGQNTVHVCAVALLQAGKTFPQGVDFNNGLSVQMSVVTDLTMINWEAL